MTLPVKTMACYATILLLMLAATHADFHTKKWAETRLKGKPGIVVVNGLLDLGHSENRGMVFGIMNGKMADPARNILVAVRIILLIGLTVFIVAYRKRGLLFLMPFILFWSGALGNLIDPFIYGYVVDFIHLRLGRVLDWPFFFNLADAYVTVGMGILLINGKAYGNLTFRKGP